ncbi:hypothetical protein FA13DRAFT_1781403 [Coprinellus micaceus]|uniref:Uncharacterized protein n=1 Tax=Coprinellus micaceus TaxID=71717 RepID=A0A4Y7SA10_COPMI|nr:hypothetical protein FA13DRAFT_1781403 [Coprinellus micaceus]
MHAIHPPTYLCRLILLLILSFPPLVPQHRPYLAGADYDPRLEVESRPMQLLPRSIQGLLVLFKINATIDTVHYASLSACGAIGAGAIVISRSILIGHNIRLAPPTSGPPPCLFALNERLSLVEHTPGLTISARRGMFGERNRIRLCSFRSSGPAFRMTFCPRSKQVVPLSTPNSNGNGIETDRDAHAKGRSIMNVGAP